MPLLKPHDERRETYFRRSLTVVIQGGSTYQADFIDLWRGCETVVGFIFDANIAVAATLGFQTAPPGLNDTPAGWYDVNDQGGAAVTVTIVAGECCLISPSLLSGLRYLRLFYDAAEEQTDTQIIVLTRPV